RARALRRTQWLVGLATRDGASAELLKRMLADHPGEDAWLETRNGLDQHLASLSPDSLAGRRVGPYRVVSLLGHGGMGSVWLAERADGLFNRRGALELLPPAPVGRGVSGGRP